MSNETGRYGVVWHDDPRGRWYSIVDKQTGEHVGKPMRNRKAAHRVADERNTHTKGANA